MSVGPGAHGGDTEGDTAVGGTPAVGKAVAVCGRYLGTRHMLLTFATNLKLP